MSDALLDVRGLEVHFRAARRPLGPRPAAVRAVDGISFSIAAGETLGVVGESGSGKTTAALAALRLIRPTAGTSLFEGRDLGRLRAGELRALRRRMGFVFQDPFGSLNPRMTAGAIVGEGLLVHGIGRSRAERLERVRSAMASVGLDADAMRRYPHEFSGGQRQRIGIARAIVLEPRLLVCDEPVSALDVSVRAQILNLILDLKAQLGLTVLFIAHDLAVVEHMSDRVAVMQAGKIVEMAAAEEIYRAPRHPYTRALLAAAPARK